MSVRILIPGISSRQNGGYKFQADGHVNSWTYVHLLGNIVRYYVDYGTICRATDTIARVLLRDGLWNYIDKNTSG